MADVVCVGDLLIDFVPTATGTGLADAPAFVKAPGGAAANVAVGLARLGVASAFMGKVGDDPFGHFLADTLRRGRASTSARCASPDQAAHRAGLRLAARRRRARVPVLPPPQRRHAVHPRRGRRGRDRRRQGASTSIRSASPARARAPRRLHRRRPARAAGHLVTYDVNLRLPLWPDAASAKAGILARPGQGAGRQAQRRRARVPDRQPRTQAARQLWHDGLKLVALSRGSAGSHLAHRHRPSGRRQPTRSPPSTPPAPATASWPA